jgi:hypothetical protein
MSVCIVSWPNKGTNFESLRDNAPSCEISKFDNCGYFPSLEALGAFAALLKETL